MDRIHKVNYIIMIAMKLSMELDLNIYIFVML